VLSPVLLSRKLTIHAHNKTDGSYPVDPIAKSKLGDGLVDLVRVSYQPKRVIEIDISGERVVLGYESNLKGCF
jgi:hypothetical protein